MSLNRPIEAAVALPWGRGQVHWYPRASQTCIQLQLYTALARWQAENRLQIAERVNIPCQKWKTQ